MSQVCRENFYGEDVETGKGNCNQHFSNDKRPGLQQVTLDEFGHNTEYSTADHTQEKCFLASDFIHKHVGYEV